MVDMKIPVIPDWCKGLPYNTRITTAEIIEFYGFNSNTNVTYYIKNKLIPNPVYSKDGSVGRMARRDKYWLLGDIRKIRFELLKGDL